ncbi:MAG: hypothetical protein HZB91_05630 [Elusimicrobia bacterium]|nr:hypothetical protein [Elusimicrobiota bacterium]
MERLRLGGYSQSEHESVAAALQALALSPGPPGAGRLAGEAIWVEAAFWSGLTPEQRAGRKSIPPLQARGLLLKLEALLGAGAEAGPSFPPRLVAAGSVINSRASAIPADLADFAVSNLFWDGKKSGAGVPAQAQASAAAGTGQQAAKTQAAKLQAAKVPPAAGLKINDVPSPVLASSVPVKDSAAEAAAAACEVALRAHPKVAAMCREHPTMAPLLAGLLEAFQEQFGTVQGIVLNLVFILMGLLLSVLSGFGLVAKVAVSLASMALLAATLGPLLKAGWDAGRDLLKSADGTVQRSDALLRVGKVGGKVLILALMAAIGWGIGKSQPGRAAVDSMKTAMSGSLRKLGVADGAAAMDARLSPGVKGRLESWFGPAAAVPSDKANTQGELTGQPARINPAETLENKLALQRQNDGAQVLAANGYRVHQNGLQAGPDYIVNGVGHDCYAPTSSNPRNILTTLRHKAARGQAHSFVVNLDGSTVEPGTLAAELARFPIPGLGKVLVIRGGKVSTLKIPSAPVPAGK